MGMTQAQLERIVEVAKSYGATRLILFGSAVEGKQEPRDIDLACDGVAGWRFFELAARLETELNTPLDLVPLTPPTRFTQSIERKGRVLI